MHLINMTDVALAAVGEKGFVVVHRLRYDDDNKAVFQWRVLNEQAFTLQEGSDLRCALDTADARGCVMALHAFVDFLGSASGGDSLETFTPAVVAWAVDADEDLNILRVDLDDELARSATKGVCARCGQNVKRSMYGGLWLLDLLEPTPGSSFCPGRPGEAARDHLVPGSI